MRGSLPLAQAGLLAVAVSACGTAGADKTAGSGPGTEPVAHVGQRAVTRQDFDAFLASTLGGPDEVAAAGAELKSRLLDQYLDDELLVSAALDKGVTVSADEVKGFEPKLDGAGEESIRRILLTRKFKQTVILEGVTVSDDEVKAWFEQHLNEYHQPARVVLRQVLVDNAADARKIRAELQAHPDKFEEIAETRSMAPDGGKPYSLDEELLPETLRNAVDRLHEGELSEVVQDPQGQFLLKLEQRQPEKALTLDEARQRIELKLLQDRSQKRYAEYVAGLRDRTKIAIHLDKLGFAYMKKSQS